MHKKVVATYNPLCETNLPYPLSPLRVGGPRVALEECGIEVVEARLAEKGEILLAHTADYVEKIESGNFSILDKILSALGEIPISEDIYSIARASAGCAVEAFEKVRDEETEMCFALTQPPGHHAGPSNARGYCIFNNAAIVAKEAKEEYRKVAIIDIDVHHGNGTQEIVLGDEDIVFASLHVKPWYPHLSGWTSKKNCANYILPYILLFPTPIQLKFGTNERYLEKLNVAVEKIRQFEPEFVIVSAGFDTYEKDPFGRMSLTKDAYAQIGKKIASLEKPTVTVLEGGYVTGMLPKFITDYCNAFRFP